MNKTQRRNLKKLADHLWALPRDYGHFSMRSFALKSKQPYTYIQFMPEQVKTVINECGTVACAAGHGPVVGIKAKPQEQWSDYIRRVFTKAPDEFVWMFGGGWSYRDDTARGAAQRIYRLLENGGAPKFGDTLAMIKGRAPLDYLDQGPVEA